MKKQPLLTSFLTTVFATAKRRLQADLRRLREGVIQGSISGYAVMFEKVLPAVWLLEIEPTRRQRSLGHIPVFWAWLAQIPEGNAFCQKALRRWRTSDSNGKRGLSRLI